LSDDFHGPRSPPAQRVLPCPKLIFALKFERSNTFNTKQIIIIRHSIIFATKVPTERKMLRVWTCAVEDATHDKIFTKFDTGSCRNYVCDPFLTVPCRKSLETEDITHNGVDQERVWIRSTTRNSVMNFYVHTCMCILYCSCRRGNDALRSDLLYCIFLVTSQNHARRDYDFFVDSRTRYARYRWRPFARLSFSFFLYPFAPPPLGMVWRDLRDQWDLLLIIVY